MSAGQLSVLAVVIFGIGFYSIVTSFRGQYLMAKYLSDKKSSKIPKENTISIKLMLTFFAATYLENSMIAVGIVFNDLYNDINSAFTLAILGTTVAVIATSFSKSPDKDKRMVFLGMGILIMISFFIFAPTLTMFQYVFNNMS